MTKKLETTVNENREDFKQQSLNTGTIKEAMMEHKHSNIKSSE